MKKRIELDSSEIQTLRLYLDDIDQHKRIATALERSLYHYVRVQFGIDLDAENWTLNIDEGTITQHGTAT